MMHAHLIRFNDLIIYIHILLQINKNTYIKSCFLSTFDKNLLYNKLE